MPTLHIPRTPVGRPGLYLMAALASVLAACAAPSPSSQAQAQADAMCITRNPHGSRQQLCIPQPAPAQQRELAQARARDLKPLPDQARLFVLRDAWTDDWNLVEVSVDGAPPLATLPGTFGQWQLSPGRHELWLRWRDGEARTLLQADAGSVISVDVKGRLLPGLMTYAWSTPGPAPSESRLKPLGWAGPWSRQGD